MKLLLKGIGSVVDIFPDPHKHVRFVSQKDSSQRMRDAWESTGRQIKSASSQFENEQKK